MNTYTITLQRISTGEITPTLICRFETEAEARAYAEGAIAMQSDTADLRIANVEGRPA